MHNTARDYCSDIGNLNTKWPPIEIIMFSPWTLSPKCEYWYKPTKFATGTPFKKTV